MPIVGLTDKRGLAGARLPRLGKLRKGAPGQEYVTNTGLTRRNFGKDLDHFRATFEAQYSFLDTYFRSLYGDTPTEFHNVRLMGNTPEEALDSWWIQRTPNKVLHQCDGVTQVKHFEAGVHSTQPIPCANPEHKPNGGCECKRRGELRIILHDLVKLTKIWGWFSVETGSIYDLLNIDGNLKWTQYEHGSLAGLYFTLGRAPKTIPVRNPKKPTEIISTEKHLLYIMVEPEISGQYVLASSEHRSKLIASGQLNPETGEMQALPATVQTLQPNTIDYVPETGYDYDILVDETGGLFENEYAQDEVFKRMIRDGELKESMSTDEAIEAVVKNRAQRAEEKYTSGTFWAESLLVERFLESVKTKINIDEKEIGKRLNHFEDKPKRNWKDFQGLTHAGAWARIVAAAYNYDYELAMSKVKDSPLVVSEIARLNLEAAIPGDGT